MVKREILSVEQMNAADAAAIALGTPGIVLMENAGAAITREIRKRWQPCSVSVLCGPGNNGGDGFVVARLLKAAGWPVRLALLGTTENLKDDAAAAAAKWDGEVAALDRAVLDDAELVVDALFGAGLTRALDGQARDAVEEVNRLRLPCVAVDVPSGVHGDSGQVLGAALKADLSVTFCRRKAAHLLLPGRQLAGDVIVADIGIADKVVEKLGVTLQENTPAEWLRDYPWAKLTGHKYDRGHALVIGGAAASSGAARLAARGALRIGAGLVTLAAPEAALDVYAAQLTAVMVAPLEQLDRHLGDQRKNAVLIGPGCGIGSETRDRVSAILAAKRACVLDADALTSFESEPNQLFAMINSDVVLTPHEGEFRRLFGAADGVPDGGDKVRRARGAAERSGAVVIFKGGDTVIAAPDGRAVINTNAPADLATAGAGDVLAGFALGLLAQGMGAFESACAAVWLHGAAANRFGPGLIAEDLSEKLPGELAKLKSMATHMKESL
ncbi:MAG: NAD(P)H-hydrate dehydratase [Rhodospirillaceae bacterium]|nr:NAD(P)H-hydrate dehydratase [Rhodospirillaceae bacterium]MBT6829354.1 NAD(P)H-hydrate dehydratase [Rhodospirillaceae bacterium]